ncbi:MAG: hypothetical protein V4608_02765 [Bacteroidota bacterium]
MNSVEVLIDNEYCKLELENGIVIATWKVSFIDIDIAKKTVNSRLEIFHGRSFPALLRIKTIKDSTKEARDFLASKEGCKGFNAGAIIVETILENMIATLYIFLNKPLVPTKIFKDEAKAKEWLAAFVDKKPM